MHKGDSNTGSEGVPLLSSYSQPLIKVAFIFCIRYQLNYADENDWLCNMVLSIEFSDSYFHPSKTH